MKYYSVNFLRNNGVDNMTISKHHAYQPMVRMWFTGGFSKVSFSKLLR